MEKYGFVYIWFDKRHKRFYIGSHWGTETDGYVCSSNWMRHSYRRRPEDFKRKTLAIVKTNREETYNEERRWLNMIHEEELGKRYYNKTKTLLAGMGDAWNKGKSGIYSKHTLLKMSKAKKGKPSKSPTKFQSGFTPWNKGTKGAQVAWNKGKTYTTVPCPPEKALKISLAQKGKPRPAGSGMIGKKHSEETKRKISETKKQQLRV